MKMRYETSRLILQVLHSDSTDQVLDFYIRNKLHLEPWEPDRSHLFYTHPFQSTNLSFEYNQIIKGLMLRLWLFEQENTDKLIGCVSFNNIIRGAFQSCVIGYKLDQAYCHQGYATEAMEKTLDIIFNEYNLHRAEAYVMPANLASIKLMDKLHFHCEGMNYSSVKMKDKWIDHLRYAKIHPSESHR